MPAELDAQPPVSASARVSRGVRRWLPTVVAVGSFAAGLGAGVALPADTTDLDAANAEVQSSRGTIENLNAELAEAEERNADLVGSLADVEDRLASAEEGVEAREAELDKRAKAVKRRERTVATREDALGSAFSAPQTDVSSSGDLQSGGKFDKTYALDITADIIEDISIVDERLRDGIGVSSALSLLSDSYGRLISAGIPSGVEEPKYYGRLTTLQSFANQAAETYTDNNIEGSAQYAVVREETGVLFDTLNGALGTQLRLP